MTFIIYSFLGYRDGMLHGQHYTHTLLSSHPHFCQYKLRPTINKYLQPAPDQHGFRQEHSTTSALLQLTTDIAMGFNQRKPPDRTVCVAVDLSAAFDTTNCCPRLTDHLFPRSHRDGYPAMSEEDKPRLASEV